MATIIKTPSGTWKALIRKTGWPATAKTFRTKRDAEDWARRTEDEMVRGMYIHRAPAERMTVEAALKRYLREVTPSKRASTQIGEHKKSQALIKHLGKYSLASEASKALSSARFVLSNKLSEHTGMKPGRFSIRDWLAKPDGGNLYINWREDMMSSMKPLVSSWADVFITSILSMPEGTHRRWWLFIDELASLEALPSLEAGLTKGRKNGLRIVAGLQSTSQLEHIYGRTMATTIRASFRNLAVLGGSRTDPQTAKDMSESLGKHEVERPKYSISRSVDHRNTSDNMDRTTEDVVTAAQIQALPALGGYVALAGDFPIARVSLPPRGFAVSATAFQESGKY